MDLRQSFVEGMARAATFVSVITTDDIDRQRNSRSRLSVGSELTRADLLHFHQAFGNAAAAEAAKTAIATAATEKQNILATAPITSLTHFHVPYLKKARDKNNLAALRIVRERMAQGTLPDAHASIGQEIDKILAR